MHGNGGLAGLIGFLVVSAAQTASAGEVPAWIVDHAAATYQESERDFPRVFRLLFSSIVPPRAAA
jgi:hypothetical protein